MFKSSLLLKLRHSRVTSSSCSSGQYTRGTRVTRAGQYTRGTRVTRAGQYTRGLFIGCAAWTPRGVHEVHAVGRDLGYISTHGAWIWRAAWTPRGNASRVTGFELTSTRMAHGYGAPRGRRVEIRPECQAITTDMIPEYEYLDL